MWPAYLDIPDPNQHRLENGRDDAQRTIFHPTNAEYFDRTGFEP